MAGTLVKICGITSAEDARHCQALGVDYLGLIFAASPRQVTPRNAETIRCAAAETPLVGVFVDSPVREVISVARIAGLNLIQLHGHETFDYCRQIKRDTGLPLIKLIRPIALSPPAAPTASPLPARETWQEVDYLLFDLPKRDVTDDARKKNTTAAQNNPAPELAKQRLWSAAASASAAGTKVFLGGNLNPDNITEVIRHTRPYAVDVCRGVESQPGVKDLAAVELVIRRALG